MALVDQAVHRLEIDLALGLTEAVASQPGYPTLRWADIRATAELADAAGIDTMLVGDHLLVQHRSGRVESDTSSGAWDSWTVLAALAATTHRVRLGPFVACALF